MSNFSFRVEVSVDEQTGKLLAAYLQVREGKAAETREVLAGRAFADYDANGLLIGIEILAPCEIALFDRIAEQEAEEPEPIKRFFRNTSPRELICA